MRGTFRFDRIVFAFCCVLILGTVSVFAGNILVSENGIKARYFSSEGNVGISDNVVCLGENGSAQELIFEDGLFVGIGTGSGGAGGGGGDGTILGHATIGNGLVSYYGFESDTYDDHGSNNGIPINGTTFTTGNGGKIGEAYDFEETNGNYISLDTNTFNWDLRNQPISIATWIKMESIQTINNIITKELYSPPWTGWEISYQTYDRGRLIFSAYDSSTRGISVKKTDITLDTDTWYYVVLTYDGSGYGSGVSIYLDGTELTGLTDGSTAFSSTTENNISCNIGSRADFIGGTFDGIIDEMAIFERELNPEEISYLYNNGNGIPYS